MKQKKVALVVGAGSVKCAAALGAARVLQQAALAPELIVGCSGGAFFAAALALGWEVEEVAAVARRFWTPELTGRHNWRALLTAALPRRMGFDGRFGLRDDRLLRQRLAEAFGELTFDDTQVPLFITCTDFLTGEQVVLQRGRLVDALRASMAIPFVFAPWPVEDRLLADGYLSDPLPSNVAIREEAGAIVALGFESPYQQTIYSPLHYAFQLSSIMTNSIYKARVAFHTLAYHADIILLAPQIRQHGGLFDGRQLAAYIQAGEDTMRANLSALRAAVIARRVSQPTVWRAPGADGKRQISA